MQKKQTNKKKHNKQKHNTAKNRVPDLQSYLNSILTTFSTENLYAN